MYEPPQHRRLPPLTALRAFESAARHLSFTRAADELSLTPSAISHQVKSLEAHLGVALFRRMHRALALTPAGRDYLPVLREAFDRIDGATRRLVAPRGHGVLTLTLTPAFAIRWLVPRLGEFQARHPEIDVRLHASVELVDLGHGDMDAAIRYGNGDWPGLRKVLLMREDIVPVCSPALIEGGAPLRRPSDLKRATLLHDLYRPDDWRMWLTAAGARNVDPERGQKFQGLALVLQAAVDGLGVAVAYPPLVERDIAAGRLVVPIDFQLPLKTGFYLVYSEERAENPALGAFRGWLSRAVPKIAPAVEPMPAP